MNNEEIEILEDFDESSPASAAKPSNQVDITNDFLEENAFANPNDVPDLNAGTSPYDSNVNAPDKVGNINEVNFNNQVQDLTPKADGLEVKASSPSKLSPYDQLGFQSQSLDLNLGDIQLNQNNFTHVEESSAHPEKMDNKSIAKDADAQPSISPYEKYVNAELNSSSKKEEGFKPYGESSVAAEKFNLAGSGSINSPVIADKPINQVDKKAEAPIVPDVNLTPNGEINSSINLESNAQLTASETNSSSDNYNSQVRENFTVTSSEKASIDGNQSNVNSNNDILSLLKDNQDVQAKESEVKPDVNSQVFTNADAAIDINNDLVNSTDDNNLTITAVYPNGLAIDQQEEFVNTKVIKPKRQNNTDLYLIIIVAVLAITLVVLLIVFYL